MAVLLSSIFLQYDNPPPRNSPRLAAGQRTAQAPVAPAVRVAMVAPTGAAPGAVVEGTVVHNPRTCALRRLDAKPRRFWGLTTNDGNSLLVHKKIASGTHSYVYHVQDRDDGREYAVKLVPMDHLNEPGRCLLESMEHEGIVKCHDHFRFLVGRVPYMGIKMDYCRDGSLREYIEHKKHRKHTIRPEVIVDYVTQIATTLAYIHGQGRLHGDLCPENILRTGRGPLKLTGFGSGRHSGLDEALLTVTGGRRLYAPPEWQHSTAPNPSHRQPTPEVSYDLWSLGCILSELVTLVSLEDRLQPPHSAMVDTECLRGIHEEMATAHDGMFAALAQALLAADPDDRLGAASVPMALPDLPRPHTKWWQRPVTALHTARNV